MSAVLPKAAERRTSPEVRVGPKAVDASLGVYGIAIVPPQERSQSDSQRRAALQQLKLQSCRSPRLEQIRSRVWSWRLQQETLDPVRELQKLHARVLFDLPEPRVAPELAALRSSL